MLLMGGTFLASWQLGYAPVQRANEQGRRERTQLSEEIAKVEAIVQQEGTMAAWLTARQQQLSQFQRRVPEPAQLPMLLNTIVDTVKNGELKLINVEQGNLEPVPDGAATLTLEGRSCYRLPVIVTAEGRYHAVLGALDQLTSERFPLVVGLERVEMRIQDPLGATLSAILHLSLYVAGPPPAASPNG